MSTDITQTIIDKLTADVEELMVHDDSYEAYKFIAYLAEKYDLDANKALDELHWK